MANEYDSNGPIDDFDIESACPESSIPEVTVEELEEQAQLETIGEKPNRFSELGIRNVAGAVIDGEPRTMDFYNGRSFSEGRALHNQARIARGLPPIPEGRR